MDILKTLSLKSNRQININFDGGDLSSDAEGLSNRLENTILGILMIFLLGCLLSGCCRDYTEIAGPWQFKQVLYRRKVRLGFDNRK